VVRREEIRIIGDRRYLQESPLTLSALGRTIGWISHAIERYADTRLIHLRARYVGALPVSSS